MSGSFLRGMATGAVLLIGLGALGLLVFAKVAAPQIVANNLPAPRFPGAIEADLTWRLQALDGGEARLADFREEIVFINNWATWCAPCLWEMPAIDRLAERMAGADMAFLIVTAEPADVVRAFVVEQGWQLPIYLAESWPPFVRTGVLPSTFILDGSRRTVFSHAGPADWDHDAAVDFLDKLLQPTVEPRDGS